MAKMIDSILKLYLAKQIDRLETKIAFLKEYQPILIDTFKVTIDEKLQKLALKQKHQLLPYAIQAGHIDEYALEAKAFDLKKVEDQFYWQQRALKQTLKRNNNQAEYDTKLAALTSKKNDAIKAIETSYAVSSDLETAQKAYDLVIEKQKNEYDLVLTKLNQQFEVFSANKKRIHDERVEKLQKKLDISMNKFNQFKSGSNNLDEIIDQDTILKLDQLSMHFGGLKAVDELSFSVKKGEIFGLIGPNGAGKTTVFNCITRFYKATSGQIYYRNRFNEPLNLNKFVVHNVIKEGIVRTFQNVELIWELPVLENLLVAGHTLYRTGFFGQLFNIRRIKREEMIMRQKALKILADLDLLAYQYAYPIGLPYGILKKIELARTLMVNPQLIILDEPAAGLNDAETDNLALTIKKIRDEYQATIFLVEHDMGLVMEICDTVCAISFGKKLAIGTPNVQKAVGDQTALKEEAIKIAKAQLEAEQLTKQEAKVVEPKKEEN